MSKESKWSSCASWLGRRLAGGPLPVHAMEAAAKAAGFAHDELVAAVREVNPNHDAKAKPATWSLSTDDRRYWAEYKKAFDESYQVGVTKERARIVSILTAEAARGRTTLARHLALKTGVELAEAVALLAAAPLETAGPGNPLQEYLASARPGAAAAAGETPLPAIEPASAVFDRRAEESGHRNRN